MTGSSEGLTHEINSDFHGKVTHIYSVKKIKVMVNLLFSLGDKLKCVVLFHHKSECFPPFYRVSPVLNDVFSLSIIVDSYKMFYFVFCIACPRSSCI